MMIFILLFLELFECKSFENCKQSMDSFQIQGIYFCNRENAMSKEGRNQVLHDSVSQNKMKAIVEEIEHLGNQNPFQYSDLAIYLNIDELHITGGLMDHSQNVTIDQHTIRITKPIYFRNLISKEILITNVYTSLQPYLKVQFEKVVLPSNQTASKTKVFTLIYEQSLSEIRSQTFEISLAVEINYFRKVVIKVLVYDKHLMCQTTSIDQCQIQGQHKTLQFGNIGIYQQYTQYFAMYNPNPIKIDVHYKQLEKKKNQIRILLNQQYEIKSASKRKFSFEIAPYSRVQLKAVINTNFYETLTDNVLSFRTQYEWIDINVNYSVQKGSLNYYPSIITLDPALLQKPQSHQVFVRSTYQQPVQLLQIENKQIKQQNYSLLALVTNIKTNQRQEVLEIEYYGQRHFNSDSKYHKQQASTILNSFGKNAIHLQTDVLLDYEIFVNYRNQQKNGDTTLRNTKFIKFDPKIIVQPKQIFIQQSPNILTIIISIINMIYMGSLLMNKQKKTKEFKLQFDSNLMLEQEDIQGIFKIQEQLQHLQSRSETNECTSEIADDNQFQDILMDIQTKQIEESSSHFSQGESLEDDIVSVYHEKVIEHNAIDNQKSFNLFQRVEFTVPQLTFNTQSSQECWDTKDPIFLPNESDDEEIRDTSLFKLEQLQNQFQHKLPQLEQSTLKFPLKWNEGNTFNPYFSKPPPGM